MTHRLLLHTYFEVSYVRGFEPLSWTLRCESTRLKACLTAQLNYFTNGVFVLEKPIAGSFETPPPNTDHARVSGQQRVHAGGTHGDRSSWIKRAAAKKKRRRIGCEEAKKERKGNRTIPPIPHFTLTSSHTLKRRGGRGIAHKTRKELTLGSGKHRKETTRSGDDATIERKKIDSISSQARHS